LALAHVVARWMRVWGEVYCHILDAKKDRPKNCILSPGFIKTWGLGSRIIIALMGGKSEGGTSDSHEKKTERNMDLSVVVFIKLAASADRL
jgi:hypothetical protein